MVAHPMAEGVAQALYREGAIKSPDVKSISVDEAASSWPPPFGGNGAMVELGLSSNSRTKSTVGRGKEIWRAGFTEQVEAALNSKRQQDSGWIGGSRISSQHSFARMVDIVHGRSVSVMSGAAHGTGPRSALGCSGAVLCTTQVSLQAGR